MQAMAKVPADRFDSMQRFLEALESPELTSAAEPNRTARGAARRLTGLVAAGVLVAAATWWIVAGRAGIPAQAWSARSRCSPSRISRTAPDGSYLGDGMTEGLIADLAQIGSLKVISGSSASVAMGTARSLAELASELGVDAVVNGSIRRTGDTVRGERAIPPRPGQHPAVHERLSGSSRRAAGPATGDHRRHHRLDQRRAQGHRAQPSRRAPGGGSTGLRGVPSRPLPPGARRARAGAGHVRAGGTDRSRLGAALRRPGQLLHDPSLLQRRGAGRGAAQGPGGAGPGPHARRDPGGSARGQRLHPGLLRMGLARRRAGVQARPRAAAQLRRRVLLV